MTTSPAKIAPKLSYDVLIENQLDGSVSTTGEHLTFVKSLVKPHPNPLLGKEREQDFKNQIVFL
ncbi:MAG: hypothetical protein ACYTX0_47500 [Nostoc sp.]